MGLFKGGALRLFQTSLYFLCFLCSGIILGIYSYFLSVLADRNNTISRQDKAVEGISGVAVLYTICAVVLTCCLGGITIFSFIGLVLDVCFVGGMIAIAVMTREGASSCSGTVNTPLGRGNSNAEGSGWGNFGTGSNENLTYSVSPRTACRLNTAAFAVSIIAAFIFVITALMQIALTRHHKKEKRYGPGPSNNYTSGLGKRRMFWSKKPKGDKDAELGATGTAVGAGGLAPGAHDLRPSHETGYTGSTVAAPGNPYDKSDSTHGYNNGVVDSNGHAPHGAHGGYYTQPQGTGINPYGYDTAPNKYTTGTATNY